MALIDNDHEKVTIALSIGGTDYTNYAVFSQCSFTSSASAQPGTCTVVLKDHANAFSFVPGVNAIIILRINGTVMWQGYAMQIEQGYFFDSYRERKWTLYGVDLNILLDKLILYNREYPTRRPCGGYVNGVSYYPPDEDGVIAVPTGTSDQSYIKRMLAYCTDLPTSTPTIDTNSQVDNVNTINPDAPFTPPDSGTTIRGFMEDVSRNVLRAKPGSSIWYISPDATLHYHEQDTQSAPFWVGDDPNTSQVYYGVTGVNAREMSVMTDISNIKNDVLLFTGNLDPSLDSPQEHVLYRKNSLTVSVNQYGRFQYSETLSQDYLAGMLNARSTKILFQEGTPSQRVTFSIYRSGLYPGQLVPIKSSVHTFNRWDANLTTLSQTNSFVIPVRAITMTFPVPSVVRYDVTCSVDTNDPWGLLLALKRPATRGLTQPKFTVIDRIANPNVTPEAEVYDLVRERPRQMSGNKFQCSYGYIRGSLVVYFNNLRISPLTDPLTLNKGFIESDPANGVFQLGFTPFGGWLPEVEYNVWANL